MEKKDVLKFYAQMRINSRLLHIIISQKENQHHWYAIQHDTTEQLKTTIRTEEKKFHTLLKPYDQLQSFRAVGAELPDELRHVLSRNRADEEMHLKHTEAKNTVNFHKTMEILWRKLSWKGGIFFALN